MSIQPLTTQSATVIQGSITVSVAATIDPVSVSDCKKHLNIDFTDDDAYLGDLITAATTAAQNFTNRQFITATLLLKMSAFPGGQYPGQCATNDEIRVPRPPLISVSSIAYVDSAGTSQTLAATEYQVNTANHPGLIRPAYGKYWPATRTDTYNAVTVTYTAGYGATAATVPMPIRQAIRAWIALLYEYREPIIEGHIAEPLPEVCQRLLWPYRVLAI